LDGFISIIHPTGDPHPLVGRCVFGFFINWRNTMKMFFCRHSEADKIQLFLILIVFIAAYALITGFFFEGFMEGGLL